MKRLIQTLVGIIAILAVSGLILGLIFWSKVPDMLANKLSDKLKVSVNIDDINLGWQKISIDEIVIGNPPKSLLSKAFSCRLIDILAPFNRYLDQKIIIDEIDLHDVYLGLEFDSATGTSGNWTRMMSPLAAETSKQDPSNRSVLIKKLVLTNIDVDVVYRKEGGKIQHLKRINRIELTNISSDGGLPIDQIMNSVLGQMLKSVFEKQNLKNMFDNLLQQPGGKIQKYLEPFQGLWNAQYSLDRLDLCLACDQSSDVRGQ